MSKGGSTTQKTTNEPPSWAKPLFKQSAAEAQSLYNSGAGGNTYLGKTVADLSQNTQQGISQLAGLGSQLPAFQSMLSQAGQPTSAQANLADMASGKYLQEGNPFYRQRLEQEASDAAAKINSQFSGAGRYGSGANTGVLGKTISNLYLQGLENDYNRASQNQLAAVGLIDGSNNANLQTQLGIANTGFQNSQAAAEAALGAGQTLDAHQQALLDDTASKWTSLDNEGWTRLGLLQSAAQGAAGAYGTQTATTKQPSSGLLGTIGSVAGLGLRAAGK